MVIGKLANKPVVTGQTKEKFLAHKSIYIGKDTMDHIHKVKELCDASLKGNEIIWHKCSTIVCGRNDRLYYIKNLIGRDIKENDLIILKFVGGKYTIY